MRNSHARRFVRSAWTLLSFQLVASIGAVAVTGLAAFHVQRMATELEVARSGVASEATATPDTASRDPRIAPGIPTTTEQPSADPAARAAEEARVLESASPAAVASCQVQRRGIRVMANVEWCDTGVQVQRGQRLAFAVRGNWSHSGEPVLEPGGGDVAEPRAVYRQASHGALIGRAGGTVFLIGAGGEIQMPGSGPLQFSINDIPGEFRDNPGFVDVFVQPAQEPPPAN